MIRIASPTCPDPLRLKELLDNCLTVDEQAELIAHLDQCSCCPGILEMLATNGTSLSGYICHPAEAKPLETSAFWPALDNIQNQLNTRPGFSDDTPMSFGDDEPVWLDFLAPSEAPEYLGRLGTYEIMEVIGQGGMGIVLKAFDPCLQRLVAIKVLTPKFTKNELAHKRFCREARAAASITHENVVAVHLVEEEESNNVPFLVMQLVQGESLQERLDRQGPLDLRSILRFGIQIASGLAAAHEQHLVHRDIKPANILIERGLERVKLTDFGLARAQEDASLTQTGFVAGTPLYMAPEQAKGEPLDHRADLFSLGSVLYAMCTGRPPFEGSTPFIVLKNVTEHHPMAIEILNPGIPMWLVEVIAKLQAKRPEDRYQHASDIAEIFSVELAALTQPLTAASRSSTQIEPCNAAKKAARVGLIAWAASGLMVACLLFSELTGWTHMVRPLFQSKLNDPVSPTATTPETQPVISIAGEAGPIWAVRFTPDGSTVAMAIDDGTVQLRDTKTGQRKGMLEGHRAAVFAVDITADGKRAATGSDDGTIKLWDLETGQETRTITIGNGIRTLVFSPDGTRVLSGGRDGGVRIHDAETGKEVVTTRGHNGTVVAVAYSKDGETIASSSGDKTIRLWNAKTGLPLQTLTGHLGGVYSVAFAPDSKTLVSGGWDKTIRIWDLATGQNIRTLTGHEQDIWTVAICGGGRFILSGSEDHTVKLWDFATGKELDTLHGHTGTVYSVSFGWDAKLMATAGRDGTTKLWSVEQHRPVIEPK